MDGGLGHRKVFFAPGPPLSPPPAFAELSRRAERLDRAWLMALSPMLVIAPAGGLGACQDLVAAAMDLDLRPRFLRLDGNAAEAPGVRPIDILDASVSSEAFAGLLDWVGIVPPASLWTPWRGHDRLRFDLADRLADALPKAPVVFEYLGQEAAASLPAEARAFVLDGQGAAPTALFLVLD